MYIGLMSGTSMDGIDVALVDDTCRKLLASHCLEIPDLLRQSIQALSKPGYDELKKVAELEHRLGELYALAVNQLLEKNNLTARDIIAIGNHGQTIRHQPQQYPQFSWQVNGAHTLAIKTKIQVISDFRQRDILLGGQGAPLAPVYHKYLFHDSNKPVTVINIGGITNLSYINSNGHCLGFDTGPGNCLMDDWILMHKGRRYDDDGKWATSGSVIPSLLDELLRHEYYQKTGPKSLDRNFYAISKEQYQQFKPEDVQATFLALTVQCIIDAISLNKIKTDEIIVCGGGVHNRGLMALLQMKFKGVNVCSTKDKDIDPDYLEAMMFAWLGKLTITNQKLDLSQITGSKQTLIPGCIYPAN